MIIFVESISKVGNLFFKSIGEDRTHSVIFFSLFDSELVDDVVLSVDETILLCLVVLVCFDCEITEPIRVEIYFELIIKMVLEFFHFHQQDEFSPSSRNYSILFKSVSSFQIQTIKQANTTRMVNTRSGKNTTGFSSEVSISNILFGTRRRNELNYKQMDSRGENISITRNSFNSFEKRSQKR